METFKRVLEHIKITRSDGVAACNVAEIKQCRQTFDNLGRYMACDSTKINLLRDKIVSKEQSSFCANLTFISAFESSPVHCRKSRPSGKRRSPGKAGTAEMLDNKATLRYNVRPTPKMHTGGLYLRLSQVPTPPREAPADTHLPTLQSGP
jgi:hypothetical protein